MFKLLADPGDEVLVPSPSYPLFDYLAALDSVRVVQYPLVYHEAWKIDFDALARSVTSRSRAIVLVNPNNPTGSFLKQAELGPLLALCREHNLALISDEVFADYVFDHQAPRGALANRRRRSPDVLPERPLESGGPAATEARLDRHWRSARHRERAFERLELIADTYLSVSAPVQWAAPALLGLRGQLQEQILHRVRANRAFLASQIGADLAVEVACHRRRLVRDPGSATHSK